LIDVRAAAREEMIPAASESTGAHVAA